MTGVRENQDLEDDHQKNSVEEDAASDNSRLSSRGSKLESSQHACLQDDDQSLGSDSDVNADSDEGEWDMPFDGIREATILKHNKVVTTIDIEPGGSRFVSAGRDCVMIWDYNGMDTSFKPFRSFEPFQGCVTSNVEYSTTGDRILVATSTPQAVVYDRDGLEILKTINGDPYIVDMRKTKGHVAALTDCKWHPFDKNVFLTASRDSTVRIWDCARPRAQDNIIVVKSKYSSGKTVVTAAAYSSDGRNVVSGSTDGSLKIWDTKASVNISKVDINAHDKNACITDIKVVPGEVFIYSRSTDGTIKMWDKRNSRTPFASCSGLACTNEQTGLCFSPSGSLLVTGTSANEQNKGSLSFFKASDLTKVRDIDFDGRDVVSVCWNKKLNQIHAGLSNGQIKALYSEGFSTGGIMLSLGKKVKAAPPGAVGIIGYDLNSCASDSTIQGPKVGPHDGRKNLKAMKLKYRPKPLPDSSMDGPKFGSNLLAPYMAKSITEDAKTKEDSREAILKYAEISEKNPYWVSLAYAKSQPKSIFAQVDPESSDDEEVSRKKRKRSSALK